MDFKQNILKTFYGNIYNSYGESINQENPQSSKTRNVYERNLTVQEISIKNDPLWTGIKALDFFAPLQKGYKMGLLGGAGVGKTVLIKEIINNIRTRLLTYTLRELNPISRLDNKTKQKIIFLIIIHTGLFY